MLATHNSHTICIHAKRVYIIPTSRQKHAPKTNSRHYMHLFYTMRDWNFFTPLVFSVFFCVCVLLLMFTVMVLLLLLFRWTLFFSRLSVLFSWQAHTICIDEQSTFEGGMNRGSCCCRCFMFFFYFYLYSNNGYVCHRKIHYICHFLFSPSSQKLYGVLVH